MTNPNPTTERQELLDQQTGLPAVPSWPRVYLLVAASFVVWVVLLRVLTVAFS